MKLSKKVQVFLLGLFILLVAGLALVSLNMFRVGADVTNGIITAGISKNTLTYGTERIGWRFTLSRPGSVLVAVTKSTTKDPILKQLYYAYSAPRSASGYWDGKDSSGKPLAAGDYKIWFAAKNWYGGNTSLVSQSITISNSAPQRLITVTANPTQINPTQNQTTTITYTFPENGTYSQVIRNSAGATMLSARAATRTAGTYTISWNGKSTAGQVLPDGTYTVAISGTTASGAVLSEATAAIQITGGSNDNNDNDGNGDNGNGDNGNGDNGDGDNGNGGGNTVSCTTNSGTAPGTQTNGNWSTGSTQAAIIVGAVQNTGYPVSFDATSSTGKNPFGQNDTFGSLKQTTWNFCDGTPEVTSENNTMVSHTFATAGTYNVRLTTLDYAGNTASTTTAVTVRSLPVKTVTSMSSAGITSAISSLGGQPGIVRMPAGTYTISSAITVPANTIIEGAGTSTILRNSVPSSSYYAFRINGNNTRLTNFAISGTKSNGFVSFGTAKNIYINNVDSSQHNMSTNSSGTATAFMENSYVHDNDVSGEGYGIQLSQGGYAMAKNNTFEKNRHAISGGCGTNQPLRVCTTGYDFINNKVQVNAADNIQDVGIDMHATGVGRIRIIGNTISVKYGIGLHDGWGEIKNNAFSNATYGIKFTQPVLNDVPVSSIGIRHFSIDNNTFSGVSTKYMIQYGTDITINGQRITPPYQG